MLYNCDVMFRNGLVEYFRSLLWVKLVKKILIQNLRTEKRWGARKSGRLCNMGCSSTASVSSTAVWISWPVETSARDWTESTITNVHQQEYKRMAKATSSCSGINFAKLTRVWLALISLTAKINSLLFWATLYVVFMLAVLLVALHSFKRNFIFWSLCIYEIYVTQ